MTRDREVDHHHPRVRVLIDCRCLQTPSPRSGVGVLAEELVRALVAGGNSVEWVLFANGTRDPRVHLPTIQGSNVSWRITRWPNKLFNAACSVQRAARDFDADVVLLPNLNFVPIRPHTRLVVVVHDLSFEHFADCFSWKQRCWHRAIHPRSLLQRADAIIAVSRTTARDVVETYGIPEEKVHVVYPGISNTESHISGSDRDRVCARYHLPEHFILTISALELRKNIDGLIAAFEQLPAHSSQQPVVHLVIAGIPGTASRSIARQIARSRVRDRIHVIGPVAEDDKRALLALADCFAYVSLWEGFGFPALEAMAAGVPVVASTGGALPEILGDAALLVDPLDPAAIARALHVALTDAPLRAGLVERGRERIAQYSWAPAAAEIRNILAAVARGPSPEYP